jgi:FAD-dependent urate hydroxylase
MRVLIVGAGIAGLTLSAPLRQKGIRARLVDRAADFNTAGYMLALFPMGNRVLHGLDAFLDASEPMQTCCRGLPLLQILRDAAADVPLDMGVHVTRLAEHGDEVEVFAEPRSLGRFDLVIGADGIHSAVRRHVAGGVEMRPTG